MPEAIRATAPAVRLCFEPQQVEEDVFLRAVGTALRAVEGARIRYAMIGGVAVACLGRPRWTRDADLFVAPQDARATLRALAGAGFATEETDQHWLYKGIKRGVLIDVLFRAMGNIYFDDEMDRRAVATTFKGVPLRVASAEDIIVIKALAHDEQTPRHWHDALAVLASNDIDWEYLIRRASLGARRVLSLLTYAQSNDLIVPESAIRSLFDLIYERAS
jgi:predicted nucleotidyltransferase